MKRVLQIQLDSTDRTLHMLEIALVGFGEEKANVSVRKQ